MFPATPFTKLVHGSNLNVHQQRNRKEDVVIHTMECYSAIKRNAIIAFATMWMDLGIVILSKVSLTEKETDIV